MTYDVIIVGAGSMGMAAGYYLSKQSKHVLLLDSHDPPHEQGSHHGETRIIRHAYGEGNSYVPMALRSQELWLELQEVAKEKLFIPTGVLNVAQPHSSFIKNVIKSADFYSLALEKLTAEQINKKWKGFNVSNDLVGYFESKSGVLFSEACIQSYRDLAMGNGAVLKSNIRVESVKINDEGNVTVKTNEGEYQGNNLVLTAGKGMNNLLHMLKLKLPLLPVRKTFSWFHSEESIYNSFNFPAFAFDVPTGIYYGFPSIEGAGVKIGRHDSGHPVTAGKNLEEFGYYPEDEEEVCRFSEKVMSSAMNHKLGKTCTYMNTPDGDFVIDNHPNYQNVFIACGFSGHGFKFSSVVGEIISQLIIDGKTQFDLTPFSIGRFN
ncbi:N-methyl-L-tryptophan oxidase [Aquibacillus halophilus]|uniref:N-methyl-L-tryptophan oxidase n=1 Tax=Aquibacillus halophilus TaxID=930132 RepID=A0A6A8D7P1_9BACI|nr:N-methyl-L-tryptophan oxidase [Aquibacillus halophilus]